MQERTCPVCNEGFTSAGLGRPRKYCSARCRKWAGNHLSPAVCSVDDCGRAHRARGLCMNHYNQKYQPDRHRKVEVPCAACGVLVEKHRSGRRKPVCSQRCRYFVTYGRWPASKELVHVGPVAPREAPTVAPTTEVTGPRWWAVMVSGPCAWCGENFTGTGGTTRYCSKRCVRQRQLAQRGKRFVISPLVRLAIYERDGWVCQLCGGMTDPTADPLSDYFPSLDHIVPQSHQIVPDHTADNLRTAHRWCNAVRGDGTYHADLFAQPA